MKGREHAWTGGEGGAGGGEREGVTTGGWKKAHELLLSDGRKGYTACNDWGVGNGRRGSWVTRLGYVHLASDTLLGTHSLVRY